MEMRALQRRGENIASLVKTFKDSIESDKSKAPQSLREEAFTGMWHFSRIREKIPAAIREMAEYIDRENPPRGDAGLALRVARISFALYMLDKMDEISRAVQSDKGFKMTALFSTARAGVGRLLDERYFMKSRDEILDGYLDAEPALAAISAVCRVRLLEMHEAIGKYQPKVASMMPEGPIEPLPAGVAASR